MTAVAFFDKLSSTTLDQPALAGMAESLVGEAIEGFHRLREYESRYVSPVAGDWQTYLGLYSSLWRLYQEWAAETEQVLSRVRGLRVVGLAELESAHGRALARLQVTPEQIARAREQAKRGEVVSLEDLRNELEARRRARCADTMA